MQKSYESVIKQLRNQNAVGVVVAVKGHIVWADMFASSALLAKYWPKLLDSYATEALTMQGARGETSIKEAERFLQNWQAREKLRLFVHQCRAGHWRAAAGLLLGAGLMDPLWFFRIVTVLAVQQRRYGRYDPGA